jgi:hypothetical protein
LSPPPAKKFRLQTFTPGGTVTMRSRRARVDLPDPDQAQPHEFEDRENVMTRR